MQKKVTLGPTRTADSESEDEDLSDQEDHCDEEDIVSENENIEKIPVKIALSSHITEWMTF